MKTLHRVRGEAEKHEIYVAAFGGHLFYDLFSQGRVGGMAPSVPPDPLLDLNTLNTTGRLRRPN